MAYQVLTQDKWISVERPKNGDRYKFTDEHGGTVEAIWSDPVVLEAMTNSSITRLSFRNRFTFQERVEIEEAAIMDAEVRVLLKDEAAATFIDLTDPKTHVAIDLLIAKGLLQESRIAEIMNPVVSPGEAYFG